MELRIFLKIVFALKLGGPLGFCYRRTFDDLSFDIFFNLVTEHSRYLLTVNSFSVVMSAKYPDGNCTVSRAKPLSVSLPCDTNL